MTSKNGKPISSHAESGTGMRRSDGADVNRACTKWLRQRGLIAEPGTFLFGYTRRKKSSTAKPPAK